MGGAVSAGEDNDELVDNLVEAEYVRQVIIEKALRAVDRGNYYLHHVRNQAYRDTAWKHENLHMSAPCIYAEVLENLSLEKNHSFLNLGSGTGYLSTVAGLLIGSGGINHGIELHSDVVEYAHSKLAEFIQLASAIDIMEFCLPKFVIGNCLLVDPSLIKEYDRVYCGAAVPPEYDNYVKRLVKVGGVIVMPSGDQLQQILRVDQDHWDVKSILPVSFASLVVPTDAERAQMDTKLPSHEPYKLQELCRSSVRAALRELIKCEHVDLGFRSIIATSTTTPNGGRKPEETGADDGGTAGSEPGDEARAAIIGFEGRQVGPRRARRRRVRRIVIPVLQTDSDEEGAGAGGGPTMPLRRRLRHRIIAIGTADLSRDHGNSGIQMNDLQWDRVLMGPSFFSAGEAPSSTSRQEQQANASSSSHAAAVDTGEPPTDPEGVTEMDCSSTSLAPTNNDSTQSNTLQPQIQHASAAASCLVLDAEAESQTRQTVSRNFTALKDPPSKTETQIEDAAMETADEKDGIPGLKDDDVSLPEQEEDPAETATGEISPPEQEDETPKTRTETEALPNENESEGEFEAPPRRKMSCMEYQSLPDSSDDDERVPNVVWINDPDATQRAAERGVAAGGFSPPASEDTARDESADSRRADVWTFHGDSGEDKVDDSDGDEEAEVRRRERLRRRHADLMAIQKFSRLLKLKLDALPLPPQLRAYLNYFRENN